MVTNIPNIQNWTVTPQNGQPGYFTLMNTWLGQSTLVVESLQTAIVAQNKANSEINALAIQAENNAIVATGLANYIGEYSDSVAYSKGESTSVSGLYYTSKVNSNLNHLVTDTNYWVYNPINDKVTKSGNETIDGVKSFLKGHLVTGASAFGYGTGSGGTVTQLTNKGTSVTLNKPNGRIVTNNASLTAGASIQFTLNNSLISITDTVYVCMTETGSALSSYDFRTMASNGYCYIYITNKSGSTLSDAIGLNFVLLKGAIS